MNNLAKKISTRAKSIAVSAIKQMPLLAQSVPNAVSLGQGIPSLPTPLYIRNKIIKLLRSDAAIGKYSLQPGVPALKAAIAKKLSAIAKRAIDPEKEIFISAGAMEALATAITAVVDRGDEVIVFDPGYASHIEQVLFAEGKPIFVPLNEKNGWALDTNALKKAITKKTKAIIVCSPSNPTGRVFTKPELDAIVAIAQKNNLLIIADEAYNFLVYGNNKFVSLLSYPQIKNRLITCFSFSKEFAMTGWRVGYMYAPAAIIKEALKIHDAFVICAPTISQYAALIALTERPKKKELTVRDVLAKRRLLICERLDRLPDLFSYCSPQGAYYILARYKKTKLNSWDFALKLLYEAGVITVPGRAFGPQGERHVRLSFGGTEKQINEAFDRIERWNKTLS